MTEPIASRGGTFEVLGRSIEVAPALKAGFVGTFALAAVGSGARVAVPILLQQAIDNGVRAGSVRVGYVGVLVMIGVVVVMLSSVCQRTAVIRLGVRSEEALYSLRVRLFDHIHRLSLADHAEEKRGALVSRVTSDIETLQQFFSWGALAFLLDGTLMVVVAMVMIGYDWLLTLVVLVIASPLLFVLGRIQKRLVATYARTRELNADVLGSMAEMVSGAEVLHLHHAQRLPIRRIAAQMNQRTRSYVRASIIGAILFPMGEVFSVFCVSGIAIVGVARGPGAGLTAGALVGFIFLSYRFLEPIGEFTEVFDQTQSAVASLRRVMSVLDTPVGPPPATEPVSLPGGRLSIEVRHVSFAYRSRTESGSEEAVLHDIDLQIPAGQVVALVGKTGSGKTTLGRLIARFDDPGAGKILVGGVDLREISNDVLRSRLIVVPQEPFLFSGSIAANMRFVRPGATDQECRSAFEALDLADWVDSLDDGLSTEVGERGSNLSAGERQLVALGRAALADPDILILDEATSSVDALTEVRLSHALERLSRGRTTIAIAHRLSTAARADRVIVLDHGRVVEDGSHRDLVALGGVYGLMFDAWVMATSTGDTL